VTYQPDPGGTFVSDAHRRVMAHLPNPDDDPVPVEDVIAAINTDPHTLKHFESADQVADVLRDLEADGHAKKLKDGWKNTQSGFDALTGPPRETLAAETGVSGATLGLDPATLSSHNGDA
jgi:hypothetical protein